MHARSAVAPCAAGRRPAAAAATAKPGLASRSRRQPYQTTSHVLLLIQLPSTNTYGYFLRSRLGELLIAHQTAPTCRSKLYFVLYIIRSYSLSLLEIN
jgi:hypothetical protein